MRRRTLIAALLAIVLCTIGTSATLAYYHDADSAENLMLIGNVDLLIVERNWNGDVFQPILDDDGNYTYEMGALQYEIKPADPLGLGTVNNLPELYATERLALGESIKTLIPSRIIPKNPVIHYVGQLPVYMAATVTINNRADLYTAMRALKEQTTEPAFEVPSKTDLVNILGDASGYDSPYDETPVVISSNYFSDKTDYTVAPNSTLSLGGKDYTGTLIERTALNDRPAGKECFIIYSEDAAADTITFTFFFFDIFKVGDETPELFDYYRVPNSFTNDDVKALTKNYSYEYDITKMLEYSEHLVTHKFNPTLTDANEAYPTLSVDTQAYCIQADSFGAGEAGALSALSTLVTQNGLDLD